MGYGKLTQIRKLRISDLDDYGNYCYLGYDAV
jgi:hypothetical protein